MKRRSFLQFFGLAPAAVIAPKVAEAALNAAEKVEPLEESVPLFSVNEYDYRIVDCVSVVSCNYAASIGQNTYVFKKD